MTKLFTDSPFFPSVAESNIFLFFYHIFDANRGWTLSISLHIHHYTTFIMPKMGGMYEMDWQVLRALLSPLLFRLSIILSRLVACLWFGKKGHRRSNIIVMLRYNFQRMMWCFFIFQGHIMWLLRILHSIFLVFCFFVSFFRLRCN